MAYRWGGGGDLTGWPTDGGGGGISLDGLQMAHMFTSKFPSSATVPAILING